MELPPAPPVREPVVDFLRSASLAVVVLFHWTFTVVSWHADGPHAGNPIGTTRGLWLASWGLQIMTVFFAVGGYANSAAWRKTQASGGQFGDFAARRVRRLLGPVVPAGIVAVIALSVVHFAFPDIGWALRGVVLVMSPLWFLGVYIIFVITAPLTWRLHERVGEVALVVGVGVAACVDVARFHYDVPYIALLNLVVVWGVVHQAGYFLDRLRAAGPRAQWSLLLGGIFGLIALTNMGLYPRSMVGVPGEAFSNMGPPTLVILALAAFQLGVVTLCWDKLGAALTREGLARRAGWIQTNAMALFLWHLPAFAIAYGTVRACGITIPEATSGLWWLQRPLWVLAPAVVVTPLVRIARRIGN